MKKTILFLFLLLSFKANSFAQQGSSCSNAYSLPMNDTLDFQSYNLTEWKNFFTFIATDTSAQIIFSKLDNSFTNINGITFYDGSCTGLVYKFDSIRNSNIDTSYYNVVINNLVVGNSYLIVVNNRLGCKGCTIPPINLNILLRTFWEASSQCDATVDPCNSIRNSLFNQFADLGPNIQLACMSGSSNINWLCGWAGLGEIPQIIQVCDPNSASLPAGILSGGNTLGLYCGDPANPNKREYARQDFVTHLIQNKAYFLAFNLAYNNDPSNYNNTLATGKLGIYLSPHLLTSPTVGSVLKDNGVAIIPTLGGISASSLNYVTHKDFYQANGNEQYLYAGCFNQSISYSNNSFNNYGAYYYMNKIIVTPVSLTVSQTASPIGCGAQLSSKIIKDCDNTLINLTGINITYQWSPSTGLNNANIQNPVFIGTSTTTYSCTATITNLNSNIITIISPPITIQSTTTNTILLASNSIITGLDYSCGNAGISTYSISPQPSSSFTYLWSSFLSPIVGTNNGTSVNINLSNYSTVISVKIIDLNTGCIQTLTKIVDGCCSAPHNSTTIPVTGDNSSNYGGTFSSITASTIAINGTFTITNNFSLSNISNVLMGPNAEIIINSGKTLTINKCQLYTCGAYMWKGITIQPGGTLIIDKSRIEDAMTAITSLNNNSGVGNYNISKTLFNRNYDGLSVTGYLNSAIQHPGVVKDCTFDCTPWTQVAIQNTGLLDAPYSNQYSNNGIILKSVKNIVIGSTAAANDKNTFLFLKVGIYALSSNFYVYNNEFKNMQPEQYCSTSSTCPLLGWAIYANEGCNSYIGGTGLQINNIHDNAHGIWLQGGLNADIIGNTFQNIADYSGFASLFYTKECIKINNFKKGTPVNIISNNFTNIVNAVNFFSNNKENLTITKNLIKKFTGQAIYCFNNSDGSISVGSTNTSDANIFNPSNNGAYDGNIAINIANAVITNSPSVRILNNQINRISRGILMTNISSVNPHIGSNAINFSPNATPTASHFLYGIRMQGCGYMNIDNNKVTKPSAATAGIENYCFGISEELNTGSSKIVANEVNKSGTGFRFRGFNQNGGIVFACNVMNQNWSGLTLDGVDIGDQGAPIIGGGVGVANDNYWSSIGSGALSASVSVRGLTYTPTGGGTPVQYTSRNFYTKTAGFYFCPPSQFIQPAQAIFTNSNGGGSALFVPNSQQICSNISYAPCVGCKQANLAKIARQQAPFNTQTGTQKYLIQQDLLNSLVIDTTVIDATPDGTTLQNFRDTTWQNTSIGKLADVALTFAKGDTLGAIGKNAVVSPKECADYAKKEVNGIYLNTWAKNIYYFTAQEEAILTTYANQDPMLCGTATFDARVLLNLDVNDFSIMHSSSRFGNNSDEVGKDETIAVDNSSNSISINKNYQVNFYPNPANENLIINIESINEFTNATLLVYDALGKVLFSSKISTNNYAINTKDLQNGIYLIKLSIEGEKEISKKIIIQH